MRDGAGRHEYDGTVQDLSPDGVRRGLAALGGPAGTKPYPDPHDEAHAAAAEEALRVRFGELELHRGLAALLDAAATPADTVRALQADHPEADGLLAEFGALVDETVAWTARHDLVPHHDVEVVVQPMPDSQRRALAGLFASAPHEADAAGSFRVTLPHADWTRAQSEQWLSTGFNRTLMPNMAIHEVAPGHASHGRALRRAATDVRRTLHSVLDLREQARARWGGDFSLRRFHSALFDLGAPPLGLLHTALERG